MKTSCLIRALALLPALVLLPAPAQAQDGMQTVPFTTSKGFELSLTPPSALNCEQVQAKLGQIDASGYRDGMPEPQNPADRALYEYELDLAAFNYERCVLSESGVTPGYDIFRRGN